MSPGAPDRTLLITGNGRDAASISISQQIGANILDVQAGVEQALADLAQTLPAGLHDHQGLRPRRVRRDGDRQRPRRHPDRRLPRRHRPARLPARLAADARRRGHAAAGRHADVRLHAAVRRDRSTSCRWAASRSRSAWSSTMRSWWSRTSIAALRRGRRDAGRATRCSELIGAARQLDADDRRRVRAARPAVGRGRPVLPRAVDQLSVAVLISLVLALTLMPLLARWAHPRTAAGHAARIASGRLERVYARTLDAMLRRPVARRSSSRCCWRPRGGAALHCRRHRLPARRRRGRLRHRLPDAGRQRARGDRPRSCRRSRRSCSRRRRSRRIPRRTGSELGLFATQQNTRRHPRPAQAARRARADRPRRSSATCATSCTEAAPRLEIEFVQLLQDMLGDLEGTPTPIEVKIFGDDRRRARGARASQSKRCSARSTASSTSSACSAATPRRPGTIDPAAAGRLGLDRRAGRRSSSRRRGSATCATDLRLLDRTHPGARALSGRGPLRSGAAGADARPRRRTGKLVPLSALAHDAAPNGQAELLRENLRQMALVSGRLEGRDLGSAVAEIQAKLRDAEAAGRLHLRDRRPVRSRSGRRSASC